MPELTYLHNVTINHRVDNEVDLVNAFKQIEKSAYNEKKLMLIPMTKAFEVFECGEPCGNPPIFKSTSLNEVCEFINNYERIK